MRHFERTRCVYFVVCIVALLHGPQLVHATQDSLELEERYVSWREDYTVNDDYTVDSTVHFQLQMLTDNAAQRNKEYSLSYSTSIEKVVVESAYTLKADGRQVEVPKNNYQITTNQGKGDGGPVFSDRTRMTIVYPDLEAGDSIVLTAHRSESEPMFPSQFSISSFFYDQIAYDDVRVNIDLPSGIPPKMQIRGMDKETHTEDKRTRLSLRYKHPKPLKSDREDFSAWDWESQNGFALSSFTSYQDIASAYGARALPKAEPTERVRQLSSEILSGEKDPKKAARLLYDWVATNISYAGNCIGVGAVVPHDLDFILDNRMGDCKDHATLLQALFTTAGIKSTQALVNSGSSYALPSIPMVASVNHVINYLPQWEQFVDATDPDMPFDTLGLSIQDKPVLLVENFKEGMKTPASQWQSTWQKAQSDIKINADGSASGSTTITLAGSPAIQARAIWRQLTQQQEKEWLDGQYSNQSKKGSATIVREDPKPLDSTYSYSTEFSIPELIPAEGAGGMYLGTPGFSPLPVYAFVSEDTSKAIDFKVACSNGSSTEKLTYTFPDNVRILAIPENFSLKENHLVFNAVYRLQDNRLELQRELQDHTPGNVCDPTLTNAQRESLNKIAKNLKSQLVFQYL